MNRQKLREAVRVLRAGGLLIYPTETAYALGCDARRADAVRAIYGLKRRMRRKPLALIAADMRMVKKFFLLPTSYSLLASRYWPGPLTLILPARDKGLRRGLGLSRIGVRVSAHPIARELSARLGAPIVATSANRSGAGNCYSIRAAERSLGMVDIFVVDGGRLPRRKPSTVVAFKRGNIVVLRKGPVRLRD